MKKNIHRPGGIREMIAIASPMVVSQACDTIMIFTDRLFLARISPELMNAAMGGGLTAFMMMSFFIGLIGYSTALTAQYFGARQKKFCPVVVTQAMIISLIAFPVVLTARPLAYWLFDSMGVGARQLGPQKAYFNILLYGTSIGLLRICLGCFFSGIGRTGIVMAASFTAMLVNVGCNYVLIYGKLGFPALGIQGAAYGTIIGGASALFVLAWGYFKNPLREQFHVAASFRFHWGVMKKLLRFGSPSGFEMILNIVAFNVMVLMFHSHSFVAATAATILFNWDLVSFVPLIGMEIAVISLVGRFMGANDPDTAHKAVMSGVKVGTIYSVFILILFVFFPHFLVGIFRPQGADDVFVRAIPLAVFMVRLAALYVLVEAMLLVFIGALRGAGDTFWAMVISVSLHWLMTGAVFVLLRIFHYPPQTAWAAMVFLFIVFSLVVYWRYRSGKWRKIRVLHEPAGVMVSDALPEATEL